MLHVILQSITLQYWRNDRATTVQCVRATKPKCEAMRTGWAIYVAGRNVQGWHEWQCIDASLYFEPEHCIIWWQLNSHRWPDVPYLLMPAPITLH